MIERFCESKLANWIGLTLMGIVIFGHGLFLLATIVKLTLAGI
jgi:hypothetical protein